MVARLALLAHICSSLIPGTVPMHTQGDSAFPSVCLHLPLSYSSDVEIDLQWERPSCARGARGGPEALTEAEIAATPAARVLALAMPGPL